MMLNSRFAAVMVGMAFWSVGSLSASAQGDDDCDAATASAHFEDGMRASGAGDHEAAITAFEAAYQCAPHPDVQYNIAQALVQLGNYPAALERLERYLVLVQAQEAFPSDPSERVAEVKRQVEQLRVALGGMARPSELPEAQDPVSLTVRCGIPGTALFLDDHLAAHFPFEETLEVAAGARVLRFRKYGFSAEPVRVEWQVGEAAAVSCQLSPNLDASTRVGSIALPDASPSLIAVLNGVSWDNLRRVPVGQHVLELEDGSLRHTQTVVVREASTTLVRLPWATGVATDAKGGQSRGIKRQGAAAAGGRSWPLESILLGAVSVIAAGSATGLHLWNESRYDTWRSIDSRLGRARGEHLTAQEASGYNSLQQKNNDRLEAIRMTDALAISLDVGAVAAALAAIYLYYADSGEPSTARMVAVGDGVLFRSTW